MVPVEATEESVRSLHEEFFPKLGLALGTPHGVASYHMEIEFLKMQGCGDDVLVLDGARVPLEPHARSRCLRSAS